MRYVRCFIAPAVLAALAVASPSSGWAASPGHNGRIAYASIFDGSRFPDARIISIRANGADPNVLAEHDFVDSPAWSPGGGLVAFEQASADPDIHDPGLYYTSASGGAPVQITSHGSQPAWSSAGGRLVFTRSGNLFTVHVDGSSLTQLTHHGGQSPAWSKRGQIAFVHSGNIYVLRSGRSARRLTFHGGTAPDWSPSGRSIVFQRPLHGGGNDIYIMRADGSHARRLTHARTSCSPAFSPDARRVVLVRCPKADIPRQLMVMNTDGSHGHVVAQESHSDYNAVSNPSWQPVH